VTVWLKDVPLAQLRGGNVKLPTWVCLVKPVFGGWISTKAKDADITYLEPMTENESKLASKYLQQFARAAATRAVHATIEEEGPHAVKAPEPAKKAPEQEPALALVADAPVAGVVADAAADDASKGVHLTNGDTVAMKANGTPANLTAFLADPVETAAVKPANGHATTAACAVAGTAAVAGAVALGDNGNSRRRISRSPTRAPHSALPHGDNGNSRRRISRSPTRAPQSALPHGDNGNSRRRISRSPTRAPQSALPHEASRELTAAALTKNASQQGNKGSPFDDSGNSSGDELPHQRSGRKRRSTQSKRRVTGAPKAGTIVPEPSPYEPKNAEITMVASAIQMGLSDRELRAVQSILAPDTGDIYDLDELLGSSQRHSPVTETLRSTANAYNGRRPGPCLDLGTQLDGLFGGKPLPAPKK